MTVNEVAVKAKVSQIVVYSRLRNLKLSRSKKASGQYDFTPEQVNILIKSIREDKRYRNKRPFTQRERDLIEEGIKTGLSERKIAAQIDCNPSTVSKHRKKLLAKLTA